MFENKFKQNYVLLLGTCVATQLVERVGRKVGAMNEPKPKIFFINNYIISTIQMLLVVSCFGTALSLGIMGLYMMLKMWGIHVDVVNWIPLTFFTAATFISAIGIQALSLGM